MNTITQGPLGFPMTDRAARAVEALLRKLPRDAAHEYRHWHTAHAAAELHIGERADISWISTEAVDRAGDVVRASGMDDREYRQNPIVTLEHDYRRPPVGRCLWRRRIREGDTVGIQAKTHYPPRPETLTDSEPWPPDAVFAHIQAGLLVGKSIGFLPLKTHIPDTAEVRRNGWPENVRLVIDRWLLLEYACVSIPANPLSVVESVSKHGLAFTTLATIAACIDRALAQRDLAAVITQGLQSALQRARGGV
jgi:hypothetical protein